MAYLLTGNHAEAEDLVQDAFIRVLSRLPQLRDLGAFPFYLNRTLVTMATSRFRRRRREEQALEREVRLMRTIEQPVGESDEVVWQHLQALPRKQRSALVLRFYLDFTEEQIADAMGCPRGTVKSLTFRGLQSLRKTLGGDLGEFTASATS